MEELYKNSQIYYLKGKRVCFSFPVWSFSTNCTAPLPLY